MHYPRGVINSVVCYFSTSLSCWHLTYDTAHGRDYSINSPEGKSSLTYTKHELAIETTIGLLFGDLRRFGRPRSGDRWVSHASSLRRNRHEQFVGKQSGRMEQELSVSSKITALHCELPSDSIRFVSQHRNNRLVCTVIATGVCRFAFGTLSFLSHYKLFLLVQRDRGQALHRCLHERDQAPRGNL